MRRGHGERGGGFGADGSGGGRSAAAKTSGLGCYDERSAEEREEARWHTALISVSHHRDLGVALYQPL